MVKLLKIVFRLIRRCLYSLYLFYPKLVKCNVCGWEGRRFISDTWHRYINCPGCMLGIRQRLFFAALENISNVGLGRIIRDKRVLHFAPEEAVANRISGFTQLYKTADYFRTDCDYRIDISNMPVIADKAFDTVIACDVLEHVPDYRAALAEIFRILSPGGTAVFTVPQKDHLDKTLEDPAVSTPEEREREYGQFDHLRIFGRDFTEILGNHGFSVVEIDEKKFSPEFCQKYVLFPPVLSRHPLATNYRKVFSVKKNHENFSRHLISGTSEIGN